MNKYTTTKSKKRNYELKKYLSGAVHSNFLSPINSKIFFQDGKGTRLYDLDNNEYLDLYGKSGALFLGHRHAQFLKMMHKSLDDIISADLTNLDLVVSKLLCSQIKSCQRVRYSLSGSEAIQNALRIAKIYTRRNKVIKFAGHYHGSSDGILDNVYSQQIDFNLKVSDTYVTLEWNDISSFEEYIKTNGSDVAAIIMEPYMLNGGGIQPSGKFLIRVQDLCKKCGIVFILDEVITGIRTCMGGVQEYLNLEPDISIWGKAIGNGIPISIIAGNADVMKLYETYQVVHAGTFNGYKLGLAAINATMNIMSEYGPPIYSHLTLMMNKLTQLLKSTAMENDLDITIQGAPNCLVLNCCKEEITCYHYFKNEIAWKNNIISQCLQSYGILLSPITRIYPSVEFNDNDLKFIEQRSYQAFKDAKKIFIRIANGTVDN